MKLLKGEKDIPIDICLWLAVAPFQEPQEPPNHQSLTRQKRREPQQTTIATREKRTATTISLS